MTEWPREPLSRTLETAPDTSPDAASAVSKFRFRQ